MHMLEGRGLQSFHFCADNYSFVPGDSDARTIAIVAAEKYTAVFNPLYIYGASGLSETHLLNAIGNYALVKKSGIKVRYVNSEEFTNEFVKSL